jgi:hypothetical protein
MEVHAHTHTPRKKWSHYFWEFLMLFLAVLCGFMAENLREHRVEKQRGRQYILSFYQDLKTDTGRFTVLKKSYEKRSAAFKNMSECFNKLISGNQSDTCLLDLFFHSRNFDDLIYTDGTLQQLKNAGGFRLLPKNDVDSILSYDNLLRLYIKGETGGFQDRQNRIRDVIYSLTNYKALSNSRSYSTPALYKHDMEMINKYFTMLSDYAEGVNRLIELLGEIKARSGSLIEYFKHKYHLQ